MSKHGDYASSLAILPATYRTKNHKVRLVSTDILSFLTRELDLERLDCIHKWISVAGLPTQPRPLHYQILKRRDIVLAEQLDLHLVWSPTRIFIKPLSRYLLSSEFWRCHICLNRPIYQVAIGFLLSWVALIERETDYKIAVDKGLIPREISWPSWLLLAEEVMLSSEQLTTSASELLTPVGSSDQVSVHRRFFYGELRVGRLNWIYRLTKLQFRGYWSGCTTYGGKSISPYIQLYLKFKLTVIAFLRDNVSALIAVFAYATIVLAAMQVGLATPFLAEDYAFGMASYVFSVFAILGPLAAVGAIFVVIVVFFILNVLHMLRLRRRQAKQSADM